MEFCPKCQQYMERIAGQEAKVDFVCHSCDTTVPGTPEQSLWSESSSVGSTDKYGIFFKRTVHDLASARIPVDCGACHRRFMILVRVEGKATYRCVCGNIKNAAEISY